MKAITLWQPWASLIAEGYKSIETRTHNRFAWLVGKRLAIHAGSRFDDAAADLVLRVMKNADSIGRDTVYEPLIGPYSYADLVQHGRWPRSSVLCTSSVAGASKLVHADSRAALCPAEGLHGLLLQHVFRLVPPLGVAGAQGVWEWTPPARYRAYCPKCDRVREVGWLDVPGDNGHADAACGCGAE